MSDKRVCFDFEVDFSNGGGIQGQGFRLDIEGDTLSDDALAAYIIRDMRLLMVGAVRILNKQIITEPHDCTILVMRLPRQNPVRHRPCDSVRMALWEPE